MMKKLVIAILILSLLGCMLILPRVQRYLALHNQEVAAEMNKNTDNTLKSVSTSNQESFLPVENPPAQTRGEFEGVFETIFLLVGSALLVLIAAFFMIMRSLNRGSLQRQYIALNRRRSEVDARLAQRQSEVFHLSAMQAARRASRRRYSRRRRVS